MHDTDMYLSGCFKSGTKWCRRGIHDSIDISNMFLLSNNKLLKQIAANGYKRTTFYDQNQAQRKIKELIRKRWRLNKECNTARLGSLQGLVVQKRHRLIITTRHIHYHRSSLLGSSPKWEKQQIMQEQKLLEWRKGSKKERGWAGQREREVEGILNREGDHGREAGSWL